MPIALLVALDEEAGVLGVTRTEVVLRVLWGWFELRGGGG